jgi:methylamine dehydrogenase heavy chain
MMSRRAGLLAATLLLAASSAQAQQAFPQPLPEEPIPSVATLPERYPDSYVFVHDLHFKSILDGRIPLKKSPSRRSGGYGSKRLSRVA